MARLFLLNEGLPSGDRLWVELPVTAEQIRDGVVDVLVPGNYLFRGMWYGTIVDDVRSYGKCVGMRAYPRRPSGTASGEATWNLKQKLS
jgi:hypothetical protein